MVLWGNWGLSMHGSADHSFVLARGMLADRRFRPSLTEPATDLVQAPLQKQICFAMEMDMDTVRTRLILAVCLSAGASLAGCAGMSRSDRATATGAAVGGVAGAVLGGGTTGAAVGAVVGGVVGHEIEKKKDK